MFFVFSTLAVLQALSLARFVASDSGSAPFLKMAKAIQNPTKHLAMHKRSSAKVNPNFVSSDSTFWLVVSIHSGTSCDSKIVKKQGVACGFCFQDDETSSSSQFQCTSETSCTNLEYDSTLDCSGPASTTTTITLPLCSITAADDDGYLTDDGGAFAAQQIVAVQGYPSTFSDGSSGIETYYAALGCVQSDMYAYQTVYENHCYSNSDGSSTTSWMYTNPVLNYYSDADCLSELGTRSVPSGSCQVDSGSTSLMMTYYHKSSSDKSLSDGAIAGIVIGVVAGVLILAALVYFFMFRQSSAVTN